MRRRIRVALSLPVIMVFLGSCASDGGEEPALDTPQSTSGDNTTTTDSVTTEGDDEVPEEAGQILGGTIQRSYEGDELPAGLDTLIAPAIDDLAQRLNLPADAIEVVQVDEVVWADASLGCPAPGMSYTPQVIDGLRILLVADTDGDTDGDVYDYRSGGLTPPRWCELPNPPSD